jgi:hypothetical protein
MGLLEKVRVASKNKSQGDREKYLMAIRNRKAEEIAEAAGAAGISQAEVERDIQTIDRAEELQIVVEKLSGLKRAKTQSEREFESAQKKLDSAIEELEPLRDSAQYKLMAADKAVQDCAKTATELVGLFRSNPDLLPLESAPAAVRDLFTADEKHRADDRAKGAALRRIAAAEKRLSDAHELVHTIEFGKWPYCVQGHSLDYDAMLSKKDEFLAKAKEELKAAKLELDAAKKAARPT